MNSSRDPIYWVEAKKPEAGKQPDDLLVRIKAGKLATHCLIVAQSGSGKSFFLGRLLEEILINTKARCVVFDPNADFARASEVAPSTLWKNASYDRRSRRGKLPCEANKTDFLDQWQRIQTGFHLHGNVKGKKTFSLPWRLVSLPFLWPPDEYAFARLQYFRQLLAEIDDVLFQIGEKDSPDVLEVAKEFLAAEGEEALESLMEGYISEAEKSVKKQDYYLRTWQHHNKSERFRKSIKDSIANIDEATAGQLLGQLLWLRKAKLLDFRPRGELDPSIDKSEPRRLEVLDLPSIDSGIDGSTNRLLAVHGLLVSEWRRAVKAWEKVARVKNRKDERVPTFLVVDEAHNLLPKDAPNRRAKIVRDQFRTIAAEGRKFGLFLVLVTQRPDKIDPYVVSECGNKAVMRIGSPGVLSVTAKLLGLENVGQKELDECLEFGTGRVLLVGDWTEDEPQFFYCAARRTIEGGSSLREEYWATP